MQLVIAESPTKETESETAKTESHSNDDDIMVVSEEKSTPVPKIIVTSDSTSTSNEAQSKAIPEVQEVQDEKVPEVTDTPAEAVIEIPNILICDSPEELTQPDPVATNQSDDVVEIISEENSPAQEASDLSVPQQKSDESESAKTESSQNDVDAEVVAIKSSDAPIDISSSQALKENIVLNDLKENHSNANEVTDIPATKLPNNVVILCEDEPMETLVTGNIHKRF